VFIDAKDDGGGGDNWTTGASRAKLQSNHHQQNNIQFFTGRMPFLSPNQRCQSTEWKISHSMDLLYPKLTWGLPTLSLITNSSWLLWGGLPCLSSALWCQYPTTGEVSLHYLQNWQDYAAFSHGNLKVVMLSKLCQLFKTVQSPDVW